MDNHNFTKKIRKSYIEYAQVCSGVIVIITSLLSFGFIFEDPNNALKRTVFILIVGIFIWISSTFKIKSLQSYYLVKFNDDTEKPGIIIVSNSKSEAKDRFFNSYPNLAEYSDKLIIEKVERVN